MKEKMSSNEVMKNAHPLREEVLGILLKETPFKGISKENKIQIEKSIYQASIDSAQEQGTIPNWDNQIFVEIYGSITRRVLTNLDKDSHVQNKNLSKKLKEINPRKVASLPPEELFPDRWKDFYNIKEQQENVKIERSNQDNIIICFKCKSNDLVVTQAQTRSADEGMTQIFSCQACGNRWKK